MLKDLLINYYHKQQDQKKLFDFSKLNFEGLTTLNHGLGDSIIITSVSDKKRCFSTSRYWNCFKLFNNDLDTTPKNINYFISEKAGELGCGNGHIIQGVQRALNLEVDPYPKGNLSVSNPNYKGKKIVMCFSTGKSYSSLLNYHKQARQLNENSYKEICYFIEKNKNYSFVEIGDKKLFNLDCVEDKTNISIEDSIIELSSADYYFGLNSGFMNIAAALKIKSIIIVNVPEINKFYLPRLKDVAVADLCWLYPQNVHLHQDGENELVPFANCKNIEKAINGEVYPFWKNDFLELINYDFTISR